jgi:peptidoglycan/LPS O-acetylase OafA/YrhL
MKKGIVMIIIAAVILITVAIWIFSGSAGPKSFDLISIAVILLVVVFALFLGFKRISSSRRGEPPEDELSKKVMQKTAGLSFYISLYLWLAIMYFSEKLNFETHTFIAGGIVGMAVIFAVCWLVINFTGIRNE